MKFPRKTKELSFNNFVSSRSDIMHPNMAPLSKVQLLSWHICKADGGEFQETSTKSSELVTDQTSGTSFEARMNQYRKLSHRNPEAWSCLLWLPLPVNR